MKHLLLAAITAAGILSANAQNEVITLDLTKALTPLEFNSENGSWTGTYDDENYTIDSQVFSFLHNSISSWQTWWGFTASNSADNSKYENTLAHQWSNMAKGGIVLNEDGTIKMDEYGAPVVSADVPYIVAFSDPMFAQHPSQIVFNDGKSYQPVGMYVNLNSYTYYSVEFGDAVARAFTNGDKFTLTIHGVAPDGTDTSIEAVLASGNNGDLTVSKGWKYVDLSALGTVDEIWFSLSSTDVGTYGANTPLYFCLDKLMVKPAEVSGVASVASGKDSISYDRETKNISLNGEDFAIVYDTAGRQVMSSDKAEFSIASLPAGVYVVKAGNSKLKIAR